ncbi:hypothetical protein KVR01_010744 [Diaporthe batatas]|uniref:uncharacterized protein n=1 Tax=Diaporthe batatas TaxID=748121 RepID=UPI001D048FBD|nr:uncharacterized protein KVR01_010744 [Diaporthe batatas]KAG8159083.1 hypothetical protein KVR01_010744 [Diaporthe batatas]
MTTKTTLLLVASTLASKVLSAPFGGNSTLSSGIVDLEITHFYSNKTGPLPLVKVGLGSPPQIVTMIIDTGSSDLISPETGSSVCGKPQQLCTQNSFGLVLGSFSPDASSGVEKTGLLLNTSFGTGETYQGPFVKGLLTLGSNNQTISDAEFALQEDGFVPEGTPSFAVFGVGPVGNEASDRPYSNVPISMKQAGVTKTSAFGVYVNDFRGTPGSIAFGGVDKAKFSGELKEVPLISNDQGEFPQFVVGLSSMTVTGGNGQQVGPQRRAPGNLLSETQPALIDTGNPELDLPADAVRGLAQTLGVETRNDQDAVLLGNVPCNLASMSLAFGFDNDATMMNVPLDLLMVPGDVPGQCAIPSIIGLQNGVVGGLTSLGNPFLQATYAVFDSEGKKILLGQAVMNVTESNLVQYAG